MEHKKLAFSLGALLVLSLVFVSLWIVIGFNPIAASTTHEKRAVPAEETAMPTAPPPNQPLAHHPIIEFPPDLSGVHETFTSQTSDKAVDLVF